MRNNTSIFVNGVFTLEYLVSLVSSKLEIVFEKMNLDAGVLYAAAIKEKGIIIEILSDHGLVNDCGIDFERFRFNVNFESNDRLFSEQECRKYRHDLTMKVYKELGAIGETEMILVEGTQKLIENIDTGNY